MTSDRAGMLRRHLPLLVFEVVMLTSAVTAAIAGRVADVQLPIALGLGSLLVLFVEKFSGFIVPMKEQLLLAVLFFCAPYLGSVGGLYDRIPSWDAIVHMYSGVVITRWAIAVIDGAEQRSRITLPLWLRSWTLVAVGGCAAAVWELIEFGSDTLIGSSLQHADLVDTMQDILCALSATVVVTLADAAFGRRRVSRDAARPFTARVAVSPRSPLPRPVAVAPAEPAARTKPSPVRSARSRG